LTRPPGRERPDAALRRDDGGGVDLRCAGQPLALFGAGREEPSALLSGGLKPTRAARHRRATRVAPTARSVIGLSHTLLYDDLSARKPGVLRPPHGGATTTALRGFRTSARGSRRPVSGFREGCSRRRARPPAHEPALLLLDEPSSGLDARASAGLREALREAGSRGATWIIATHDVEEGLALCPRWIALRRGRVIDGGASVGVDATRVRELVRGSA
jgi:hypothetical protein